MISYKEFLNKRNEIIREGFKDSDMDRVFILIRDSINKHISNHITALHGTENTKVDDEYMITKYYLVGGLKRRSASVTRLVTSSPKIGRAHV